MQPRVTRCGHRVISRARCAGRRAPIGADPTNTRQTRLGTAVSHLSPCSATAHRWHRRLLAPPFFWAGLVASAATRRSPLRRVSLPSHRAGHDGTPLAQDHLSGDFCAIPQCIAGIAASSSRLRGSGIRLLVIARAVWVGELQPDQPLPTHSKLVPPLAAAPPRRAGLLPHRVRHGGTPLAQGHFRGTSPQRPRAAQAPPPVGTAPYGNLPLRDQLSPRTSPPLGIAALGIAASCPPPSRTAPGLRWARPPFVPAAPAGSAHDAAAAASFRAAEASPPLSLAAPGHRHLWAPPPPPASGSRRAAPPSFVAASAPPQPWRAPVGPCLHRITSG